MRVATVRAFAARAHRPALARIEGAIKGKRLQEADLTERMALFEAFGAMCGDAGISLWYGLLNAKACFGKREDPELRACAAMALGRVGSADALAALRRASSDKEILGTLGCMAGAGTRATLQRQQDLLQFPLVL